MSALDQEIGMRLRIARKKLFKSARAFAQKFGIPESTYSQHETGKRSLNPVTMVEYCRYLNVNPGWVLTGKGEELPHGEEKRCAEEVTLKTSHRQAIAEPNPVAVDMDIFRTVLRKALQDVLGTVIGDREMDLLITFCKQTYGVTHRHSTERFINQR